MQTEHSCPSLTETDGSLGPRALRSWGVLEEGRSGMGKKQSKNSRRPQACMCVCVVCPVSSPYITRVCCSDSCVCNKKLTAVSFLLHTHESLQHTRVIYGGV